MEPDAASVVSYRLFGWVRADDLAGHSMARVERHLGGWRFHGAEVVAPASGVFSCSFVVEVDDAWVTRAATVRALSDAGACGVTLIADDERRWWVDGVRRPDLDGCLDVDVAATPLTNTFPIRRLARALVGEEVTTQVAWVAVPSLSVGPVVQSYRRLPDVDGLATWEYRDDAHGRFALRVDEDGVVVDYEGFARRVAATPWRGGAGGGRPSTP